MKWPYCISPTKGGKPFSSLQGTYRVHGQTPGRPVWDNHITQWAQDHRQRMWKKRLHSTGFPACISLLRRTAWLREFKKGLIPSYEWVTVANWMFAVFNWTTLSEYVAHCAGRHRRFPQLLLGSMKINQTVKNWWTAQHETQPGRAFIFTPFAVSGGIGCYILGLWDLH